MVKKPANKQLPKAEADIAKQRAYSLVDIRYELQRLVELKDEISRLPYRLGHEDLLLRLISDEKEKIKSKKKYIDRDVEKKQKRLFRKDNRRETQLFKEIQYFYGEVHRMLPDNNVLKQYVDGPHVQEKLERLAVHIYSGCHYGVRWPNEVQEGWERDCSNGMSYPDRQSKYTPLMKDALILLCDPIGDVTNVDSYIRQLGSDSPDNVATRYLRGFLKVSKIGRKKGRPNNE